jgi:hypothetical protein
MVPKTSIEITLTQEMGYSLKVAVCRYVPRPGEMTWYEWTSKTGVLHKEQMPLYCLKSRADTVSRLCEYAETSRLSYLGALLDGADRLIWDTFNIALRSQVSPALQECGSILT